MNSTDHVTDTIRYIGVDDNDIQLFENQYPVPKGISYNSYLVHGSEASIIFDTVDSRRLDPWKELVETVVKEDGREPAYIVMLHAEPDHTGGIVWALERFRDIRLVASQMCLTMLAQFYGEGIPAGRTIPVKEGSVIDLGDRTLTFHTAPMIHWPEVMMAVDSKEEVLFSADAFGRFGSLGYGDDSWDAEARRYYTNIVGKYGSQVQNLLKKLSADKISIIASLHGPVLRKNLQHYGNLYNLWSSYTPELPDGVLVAYASIYGGTERVALRAADVLRERGVEVAVIDLCRQDASEAVSQAFRMGKMLLASVTYDAGLFPAMNNFLYRIASKGLRGRRVALIENGTWSPIAAKAMRQQLEAMKDMEVIEPVVTVRSAAAPSTDEALQAAIDALTA